MKLIKAVQQARHLCCSVNYFSWIGIKILKQIEEFGAYAHTLLYLMTCSFRHSNKNISKQNF